MAKKLSENEKFNKDREREEFHNLVKYNLFLIRELFQLIAIKESYSVQALYTYLFADEYDESTENIEKKCRDKYQHLMYDTCNISETAKNKLIDCGIAPDYFSTKYIEVNDELDDDLQTYLYSAKNSPQKQNETIDVQLSTFRASLLLNYETIKDVDGTPLIYFIRELVNRANNCTYNNKKELYTLTDKVALFQSPEYYTGKNTRKLYETLLEQYKNSDTCVADTSRIPTVNGKNIYTNKQKSEAISANYFIVRELYKLFAEIDDVGNALEKFYSYLNISEQDYQNIIDTGIADNKALAEKLIPFQFPANMFRGDNPTYITMDKSIINEINYYLKNGKNNMDYQIFLTFLRLQILYVNRPENISLVFPVYNLLHTIKQADTSAEIDYKEFLQKHPTLLANPPKH